MSVVVAQSALAMGNATLSDIEYAIKLNADAQMALLHQSQAATGNEILLAVYHELSKQLEAEKIQLETEYQAIQAQLEAWKKMRRDAIKRSFSIDI